MVQWAVDFLRGAGISDLLLVTGADHVEDFRQYFADEVDYAIQQRAGGIAEALGLARGFAAGSRIVVMLADNFFSAPIAQVVRNFEGQPRGARVLLARVRELEHLRNLGVPRLVASATEVSSTTCSRATGATQASPSTRTTK